ncbi:MAG: ABC transporter ATP-binding protein [Actinomycetota bacterium]
MAPVVRLRDLHKRFQRGDGSVVSAIDGVSLDVHPGELIVLLGPSGCGKTTLLRSVAGLERPDAGLIEIHGTVNFSSDRGVDLPPERRKLSMIFQSYALWPHMTAFQNVAYPLEAKRKDRPRKNEIKERVERVLALVGIPELGGQYPNQMSGGQQQRVALARSLVSGDGLVLFDEPLSNVDAKVREQLRIELVTMQRELGFSAIFVTHDQVEAMELAHRIAVMRHGHVAQLATPREVYDRPATRYVANFIGTTNELMGKVERAEPETVSVSTPHGKVTGVPGAPLRDGDEVAAQWRPERCVVTIEEPDVPNRWRATVRAGMFVGSHTEYLLQAGDHQFRTWSVDPDLIEAGTEVWLSVVPQQVRVLPVDEPEPGSAVSPPRE